MESPPNDATACRSHAFMIHSTHPNHANEAMFLLSLIPQLIDLKSKLLAVVQSNIEICDLIREMKSFLHIFNELIAFCGNEADQDIPISRRQYLLAEMNCVNIVVSILQCLFSQWGGPINMYSCVISGLSFLYEKYNSMHP